MTTSSKRKRRRFQGLISVFSITISLEDRQWIDTLAARRAVGAVEIVRNAIAVYQSVLRIIVPNTQATPTLDQTLTLVRNALTAYLAQQPIAQPDDLADAKTPQP